MGKQPALKEGEYMRGGYIIIGKASTLEELSNLLPRAIELAGKDAKWGGFDDGHLWVEGKDTWVGILSAEGD